MRHEREPLNGLRADQVIALIADATDVSVAAIMGGGKAGDKVGQAKRIAAWLLHRHMGLSGPVTGGLLDRDHSTIAYAARMLETEMKEDATLASLVRSLAGQVDMLRRLNGIGMPHVVEIARRAVASPHGAMSASVNEITAIAAALLDAWETLEAASALCELAAQRVTVDGNIQISGDEAEAAIAISEAIADAWSAVRRDAPLHLAGQITQIVGNTEAQETAT